MMNWEEAAQWWRTTSKEDQTKAFNTPDGHFWTCPDCGRKFSYHSGPPTSGGFTSCFLRPDSQYLFEDYDGCCGGNYRGFCFPWATKEPS